MKNWLDLANFIRNQYPSTLVEDDGDKICLMLDTTPGRQQELYLLKAGDVAWGDWVQITSAIGRLGTVDLPSAMANISNKLCGGLAIMDGDVVVVRHAVALLGATIEEIQQAIALVTVVADSFEQKFGDGDDNF
jgi:hypothetical protein